MEISATIHNSGDTHHASVTTAGSERTLSVAAKSVGRGSSVNGGEFLMLALATCYCNDLYREAERLGVPITSCEVTARAEFNGVGLPAVNVAYAAKVESSASADEVERLLDETDRLAEVHNTLRTGCAVQRVAWSEAKA